MSEITSPLYQAGDKTSPDSQLKALCSMCMPERNSMLPCLQKMTIKNKCSSHCCHRNYSDSSGGGGYDVARIHIMKQHGVYTLYMQN